MFDFIYVFLFLSINVGTGKKQSGILSFVLVGIKYIDKIDLNTLHFILNNKKELIQINQLIVVYKYVKNMKVQTIFPILNDKLPDELKNKQNICVLSPYQEDKLFRIERTIDK